MNKIKIDEIKITISGKDRNHNYTLEPEDKITKIQDALDYLEAMKDDVEEEEIPF